MNVAIIGAGWAGLAAAVEATRAGHQVSVFESSHACGGRARATTLGMADGTVLHVDNGQHILIGAYRQTLRLLQVVGVEVNSALLQIPMTLLTPQGQGICLPELPGPLDALVAVALAKGWSLADKGSLLRAVMGWQRDHFQCPPALTVAQLCQGLRPRVLADLIAPLCLSALNTPAQRASAQVFLRVLHDAVLGPSGCSRLLLPRVDLSQLFPRPAQRWLVQQGAQLHLGASIESISQQGIRWQLQAPSLPAQVLPADGFDALILATSAHAGARLLRSSAALAAPALAAPMQRWSDLAQALAYEAIACVYACCAGARLSHPMLRLDSDAQQPAQFVFDRGQLGGAPGLLAFVVSASRLDRAALTRQVLAQGCRQLGLQLQGVQTLIEKRATFACSPELKRPPQQIASGLYACGDYVAGVYPATLEAAVRSAVAAVAALPL